VLEDKITMLEQNITEARREAADHSLSIYDFGSDSIKEVGEWQMDGDEWSTTVGLEMLGGQVFYGNFTVLFKPNSSVIDRVDALFCTQ
jgi:hypothetical protein